MQRKKWLARPRNETVRSQPARPDIETRLNRGSGAKVPKVAMNAVLEAVSFWNRTGSVTRPTRSQAAGDDAPDAEEPGGVVRLFLCAKRHVRGDDD
jgi:hypothetical protein